MWPSERLRNRLEQATGIGLSQSRFAMLLEREGYVYRRPKRDLTAKQDKTVKQQAAELLDGQKRGAMWIPASGNGATIKRFNEHPFVPSAALFRSSFVAFSLFLAGISYPSNYAGWMALFVL